MKRMEIKIAKSDSEILACYSVMKELRHDLVEEDFVSKIRSLEKQRYQLAMLCVDEVPVALAGFRIGESLAWKKFLYVDDLVTAEAERSKGYGANLLCWLNDFAVKENCEQLHLDSGIQRKEAHKFYEREGMQISSYHFARLVAPN